jgi:CRISPR-associated endoribonuclease Cas6
MRLRLDVVTAAEEVPWRSLLAPGRALAYDLLARAAPELGRQLHTSGWGEHGMVPFGYGAPLFPAAPRRRGVYAAGGQGVIEFGSPLIAVVEAWARGLRERELIDWGGVAMRIVALHVVDPPEFSSGHARMRTETPVVMKGSGRDGQGNRPTRQAWLLPTEPEFPAYFQQSLRRKAETLGLSPEVKLDAITWVGPKRSFVVGDGAKPGAALEAEVSGEPAMLQALWSWGLGQANSAGFGWVTQ